jgi:hypothetical protein
MRIEKFVRRLVRALIICYTSAAKQSYIWAWLRFLINIQTNQTFKKAYENDYGRPFQIQKYNAS